MCHDPRRSTGRALDHLRLVFGRTWFWMIPVRAGGLSPGMLGIVGDSSCFFALRFAFVLSTVNPFEFASLISLRDLPGSFLYTKAIFTPRGELNRGSR